MSRPLYYRLLPNGEVEPAKHPHNTTIARTVIGEAVVMTEFLAIDLNVLDNKFGPPVLFQTLIRSNGFWTGYNEKHGTYWEAMNGHRRAAMWWLRKKHGRKTDESHVRHLLHD